METKQYLMQISKLDKLIKNKLCEISQLKELSISVSAIKSGDKIQKTPDFDKIGNFYCKIEFLENNLNALIDEYVDKKEKIISQIDSMEDEIYYEVLFERYIQKKTFERIAADMNYSFRNITRVHGKALKAFEKKYGYLYLEK